MSYAREMLDAAPGEISLDADDVATCIDACLTCTQACTSCADSDLAEDGSEEMRRCVALDADCADVCDAAARLLSRPMHWDHVVIHHLLKACVRTCQSCAEECEQHAQHHRHCKICAQACRACERACTVLLEDEAFQELQKIAGG